MVFFQKNIASIKQIMASLGGGRILPIFNDRSNFKVSHIIAIGRRTKKFFVKKK